MTGFSAIGLTSAAGSVTLFKVLILLFVSIQLYWVDILNTLQQVKDKQQSQANGDFHGDSTFDYIIVGGGVAGCIVANRLSRDPKNSVLLLERYGDPSKFTEVPILASRNLNIGSDALAYIHRTTTQANACGAAQGQCFVITGKGLGGSSNINGLINTRGSPQVFDAWAEITNDSTWRYENVLPAFKRLENYHGFYSDPMNKTYHSTGGEWDVSNADLQDGTEEALNYFFSSAASAGYPLIDANNGAEARNGGYAHFDFNIKNGQRWSLYKAFLEPILQRPNLVVLRYAHVTKVHLNFKGRASGVTYRRHGKTYDAHALKEVILSAGTFGSAQLLMLSGIGPQDHLEELGIEVQVDSPVGKTLIDHAIAPVIYSVNKTIMFYPERDTTPSDVFKYLTTKTGYLSKVLSATAVLFTKSSVAKATENSYPDLEMVFTSLFGGKLPTEDGTRDYFAFTPFLIAPKSAGNFKLKSRNPNDEPLINPNYLADPQDVQAVIEGLELSKTLMNTPELKAIDIKQVPVPNCDGLDSTEYWTCYAKIMGQTGLHFVATCKMGTNKETDVVDSKLRVFGTRGLRVIDASVMPVIPNAHTTAATAMIAEIGSNFILNAH